MRQSIFHLNHKYMNSDSITLELLRSIIGKQLETVVAQPYPGYNAYSTIVLGFADNLSITIDLSDELVAPMFEVFVARARQTDCSGHLAGGDKFEFLNFVVEKIFILRREEWIAKESIELTELNSQSNSMQRPLDKDSRLVDSGICLISARGAELRVEADNFPLVLQFRYKVASSLLSQAGRVPLI